MVRNAPKRAALSVALFVLLYLTGCGTDSAGDKMEPTTELTICIDEYLFDAMKTRIFSEFADTYPDVKVTYEVVERVESTSLATLLYGDCRSIFAPLIDDEYRQTTLRRIQTEVMSGRGPDLFIMDAGYYGECVFQDINKTMRSGVFCDLLPLFVEAGISEEDFIKPVFDAGKVNGQQLVAPLDYQVYDLLTYNDLQTIVGSDQIGDTAGVLAGIRAAMETPGTAEFSYPAASYLMLNPYYYTAQPLVYYDAGIAQIDTPLLRDILETWKSTKDNILGSQPDNAEWRTYLSTNQFLDFNPYFMDVARNVIQLAYIGSALNFEPMPSEEGGVCAVISSFAGIRLNSGNKLNAVNMVNLLLSEKYQIGKSGAGFTYPNEGYPVRKGVMDKRLSYVINDIRGIGSSYFSINPAALPEENRQMFLELESEITTARFPTPTEVNDILSQYYSGDIKIDTAIARMQDYWDKSLEE